MKQRKTNALQKVFLETFILLLIITIAIIIYKSFNPFSFPGIEQRLIAILLIVGFLLIVSSSTTSLKSIFSIKIRKKRLEKRKVKIKTFSSLKSISDILNSIKLLPRIFLNSIKSLIFLLKSFLILAKNHPIKALFLFLYLYFLYWIYPSMSIHEFSFFLLLLYIPISIKLGLDERIPVVIAIFLLILAAITLAQGFENHANTIAIYAYYFLVIGVALMFFDYIKNQEK